jgi:hypothetical protein
VTLDFSNVAAAEWSVQLKVVCGLKENEIQGHFLIVKINRKLKAKDFGA